MEPIRIAVAGAGRMGQAVREAVDAADDLEFAGFWRRGESIDDVVVGANVLIDFSLPGASATVLAAATSHGKPLVCGVSGLDDAQQSALRQAASVIPVVFDRNMSQGVTVMQELVRQAAAALGSDFEAEIHEVHHVHKVDAPSGTALKLGEAIAAARGTARVDDAVRFEVERRGEVPGDHTVTLKSSTETLTLRHSVTTRAVFAEGALRAARWVVGQAPGLYQMRDVLLRDR